jgi:hypothetical protein
MLCGRPGENPGRPAPSKWASSAATRILPSTRDATPRRRTFGVPSFGAGCDMALTTSEFL